MHPRIRTSTTHEKGALLVSVPRRPGFAHKYVNFAVRYKNVATSRAADTNGYSIAIRARRFEYNRSLTKGLIHISSAFRIFFTMLLIACIS